MDSAFKALTDNKIPNLNPEIPLHHPVTVQHLIVLKLWVDG
jgi:hypothetical protein